MARGFGKREIQGSYTLQLITRTPVPKSSAISNDPLNPGKPLHPKSLHNHKE